ncbi:peptidase inhibitor family I36 protein [Streptomyces sp. VRA16 Mangrove soil]|uniref:peptidase inhibitor family I36 protein n=1 Tax=Streptomyces sp. VRA16 Mangrove soil TaxID=2817434 RepID=UPI001A9EB6C9|nr:peptidase inhibitor family I36 protein [Streptomyces sp. VRA16 Mangrove soil]MBO1337906.1 peptidase inhibitor family I36 protein [Streptomyces sp. VRA16 Mangrove soil]
MHIHRLALAGATLIAALPLVLPSPPATASAPPAAAAGRCSPGFICTWEKPHFRGLANSVPSRPGCYEGHAARSVSNQSGHRITLYSDTGCYGSKTDLKTGHYSDNTPWKVWSVAVWGP